MEWIKNLASSNPEKWAGEEAARFIVFLALFDFGLLFFIPTIILITLVHRRGIQIKYKKRENRLIDTWSYELTPYRIPRVRLNQETSRYGTTLPPVPAPPSTIQVQDVTSACATDAKAIASTSPIENSRQQLVGSTPSSSHLSRGRHRHRHRHQQNYPHHTYHSRQRPVTTADIPSVSGYLEEKPRRSSSTGHLLHESSATIYFEPNQRRRAPFNPSSGYDNQALTDDSGKLVKSTSFLTSDQLTDQQLQQQYGREQHQIPRSPAMTSFYSPHQYNQNAIYNQSFNEQSISSSHLHPTEDRRRRTSSLEAELV